MRAAKFFAFICLIAGVSWEGPRADSQEPVLSRYRVKDTFTINDIPAKVRKVRVWLELPRLDDEHQKIENLNIESPVAYRVEKDASSGNSFLYLESQNAGDLAATISVSFLLERKSVALGAAPSPQIKDRKRYLASVPNVPVDASMKKLAHSIAGEEKDPLNQARRFYDYLMDNAVYYRKEPQRLRPSGAGSALYCYNEKTGNCTDFHALFMSLTRSVGIPSQFVMGSYLSQEKEGREDPAYHCWAKFFDERYGWIPVDAAYGNLWEDKREFYFGHLDGARVAFTEGRNINLAPRQKGPALNYFVYGYLEVDGKPQGKIERKLIFESI